MTMEAIFTAVGDTLAAVGTHFPDEVVESTPPYLVWRVLDQSRDDKQSNYVDEQGGYELRLQISCWGTTRQQAVELFDTLAAYLNANEINPTGLTPLHRPRLEFAQPIPDQKTRYHQVVSRWYFSWSN